jgi:hypothetical protein
MVFIRIASASFESPSRSLRPTLKKMSSSLSGDKLLSSDGRPDLPASNARMLPDFEFDLFDSEFIFISSVRGINDQ